MKTFDFETGKRSDIYKSNTVVVNEMLLTVLTCVAVGYMATNTVLVGYKHMMDNINEIRKLREENRKRKEDRKKEKKARKEERRKEREERRERREKRREEKEERERQRELEERAMKVQEANSRYLLAYENSIKQLTDGKDKENALKKFDGLVKISQGKATKEELEMAEQDAKHELSAEEKKATEKIKQKIDKISDEDIQAFQQKHKIEPSQMIDNINDNISKQDEPEEQEPKEPENSKEEIKDMEVTDPKTGKKSVQKVHIGPQGGKYYWPDGSPHDAEHKVYVNK